MEKIDSSKELAVKIKTEEFPILISGWLLGMSVRNISRPLWCLVVLPLSSLAGVFIATIAFLMFLFSKWILMLIGLFFLNGESLDLWSIFFFLIKAGAVLSPAIILVHAIYLSCIVVALGGGFASLRKLRNMKISDAPNEETVLEPKAET